VAEPAIAAARDNFALNGLDPQLSDFVAADAFAYLDAARSRGEHFGLVITDPPSFAHSREQLRAALKAYRRLHALAVRVVEPGGLYVASSCTAQVSPELFRGTLAEAAARTGRRLQIVHEAGHALDHPICVGHPEGRYLKFVVARVLPVA